MSRTVVAACLLEPPTGKWRNRFAIDRLDGLVDAPRLGPARTIGDDVVEAIAVETLETAHPDATHWSTRGLAPLRPHQLHDGMRPDYFGEQ